MINEAMYPPDKNELNQFTKFIYERGDEKYTLVRARDGRIFEVTREIDEDGAVTFTAKNWGSWWYANGESCYSHDYDLVEIIGCKTAIRTYLKKECNNEKPST